MNESKKMKACVLKGIRNLNVEQVDIPEIKEGQVLVRIRAAGICGSDVERVYTKGTYHYPTIIGHEFAGEVVQTKETGKEWLGKRVTVFPLIPCMHCAACKTGNYAQCNNYNYYGSRCDGGFAEYLAVNIWNLLPISDKVSFESAAMFEPAAVAVHALAQAGMLQGGRSIAIFGVGTIGLIMAQIARNSGCSRVILVARSDGKELFAQKMGFMDVINSKRESVQERIREITNGQGVDVAVEGCGKSETINECLNAASAFGTVICMGNPAENMTLERDAYWRILRKQLTLRGTWNSSFQVSHNDWKLVLELVENGKLKLEELVTGRYSLEQANKAFEDIYYNRTQSIHVKSMFISEEEHFESSNI